VRQLIIGAGNWGKLARSVRLMPPAYVKAYVKRVKTDAADAEAICEAVTRPTMRFVAVKSMEQQGVLMMHKTRDLLVRQRTMLINALRGHLAELGIIAPQGAAGVKAAIEAFHMTQDSLPALARKALHGLIDQMRALAREIEKTEKMILAWDRQSATSRRLADIPGIGPITASAITAAIPDATLFSSGRAFAAWLGLTPRSHSSGGREKLVGITKRGGSYIRRLLVIGATAVIRRARQENASKKWAAKLLTRKPARLVSVGMANKTARISWALLARNPTYVAGAARA
jgi:transposase